MADRPAPKPIESDSEWQTVDPSEWQTVSGNRTPASAPEAQPDSVLGGAGRELKNIGMSMMSAYKPQDKAEMAEDLILPGGAGVMRAVKGYLSSAGKGLHQAREYAREASEIPSGNLMSKGLEYARSGTTALGAINPLTSGTTENVNDLSDQGRMSEAAGSGLADAALLATPFVVKGGNAAIEAIPTRAKAGALLDQVKMAAGNRPVNFARTVPELEKAQRLSLWGHGNVTPLDSLYQRINTVNPVDFEEARGRYTPLTRLTASDTMRATPQLQAASKRVAGAMRADIGDTAEQVGMRPQYEKGMSMYARASRNAEMAKKALKYGGRAAAGAAGAGGVYSLYHALKD